MADIQNDQPKGSDASGNLWRNPFRRRPQAPKTQRGIDEDRWTWLEDDAVPSRGGGRLRRSLAIAGFLTCAAVILGAIAVAAIRNGDQGEAQVNALPTPTRTIGVTNRPSTPAVSSRPTVTPRSTVRPSTTATPISTPRPTSAATAGADVTPTRPPQPSFVLSAWNAASKRWQSNDLELTSGAGQTTPFLLRIDNTSAGSVYQVLIQYDCGRAESAGFEFLTGYDRDSDGDPFLSEGGPGSLVPDVAILIPDDPATTVDDSPAGGQFRAWGATFDGSATGPVPVSVCTGEKSITVRIRPRAQTVYLLWAGHAGERSVDSGAFGMQADIEALSQGPERLELVLGN